MKHAACIFILLFTCLLGYSQARFNLHVVDGTPCFEVQFDGMTVIPTSPLGLNIDNIPLGSGVTLTGTTEADAHHRTYLLKDSAGRPYGIEVREFDDGVAFRYCYPTRHAVCIYGEQTAFTFPGGTHVWYASGPFQYGWLQAYQDRGIENISGELLAPPATFLLKGGVYAALTEANLRNYHGAVMFGCQGNRVQFGYMENKGHMVSGTITGLPESRYYHAVVRDVPFVVSPRKGGNEVVTPWRVLMLAHDLDGLVNNHLIASVSDQPDPMLFPQGNKTEWIKPGRASFTWLVEDKDRLSIPVIKRYVDGVSQLGLEYVLIDDGWENWPNTQDKGYGKDKWEMLRNVVDYAMPKHVGIWVWRSSCIRLGNVTDRGLIDPVEREDFMSHCEKVGVKGLKIDFFHTENLFTVNLMENILKDAARHHLMVIFHGVNKPTGDSYTYPNLLAKEAVRGLECVGGENSWAPGPSWPYHNTVLPFTRWLAGPTDYTPLNFRGFCSPQVTFGMQIASIYLFTSPMLILSADIDDMLNCPARKFIEDVPVMWDETRVLGISKIGKVAAIARRKGNVWYLAVINGDAPMEFKSKLPFLSPGKYTMQMATDGIGQRRRLVIKKGKVTRNTMLREPLQAGGGFVVKFEPKI